MISNNKGYFYKSKWRILTLHPFVVIPRGVVATSTFGVVVSMVGSGVIIVVLSVYRRLWIVFRQSVW